MASGLIVIYVHVSFLSSSLGSSLSPFFPLPPYFPPFLISFFLRRFSDMLCKLSQDHPGFAFQNINSWQVWILHVWSRSMGNENHKWGA